MNMTDRRRAVIFGGDGFIGRSVTAALARTGTTIIVASRNARSARHLLPMGDPGQIVLADATIRDDRTVAALIAGADTVINLVGILYEKRAGDFTEIHQEGAGRIARHAAVAGVRRLVHISAIGADPTCPSLYARSKGLGEADVLAAFPAATVLRPSIVVGAEDSFFNRFAELARRFHMLPLIGGGASRFQPVHVDDIAAAVGAALIKEDSAGRIYELGGPGIYSFRELMVLLRETTRERILLLQIPWSLARIQARFAEFLPAPPLTRDQLLLLRRDNVVAPNALTFAHLGIAPTPLEAVLPLILQRFHRLE
jgi:uncharacterized protein YbjT (DUF2867 family)